MRRLLLTGLALVMLNGCGIVITKKKSETRLSELIAGQRREEVIKIIGKPDIIGEPQRLPDGSVLQIDRYSLYPGHQSWTQLGMGLFTETFSWWLPMKTDLNPYQVRYINGVLDRWGPADSKRP